MTRLVPFAGNTSPESARNHSDFEETHERKRNSYGVDFDADSCGGRTKLAACANRTTLSRHGGTHAGRIQGVVARAGESTQGRAQRRMDSDRRRGLWRSRSLWRIDRYANLRCAGQQRPALYQLSHHRDLRAHALGIADRTQQRLGACLRILAYGDVSRLPWMGRPRARNRGHHCRDFARQRLQQLRRRKVRRNSGRGSDRRRPVRPLADREGLRSFLWISRLADRSVSSRFGGRSGAREARRPPFERSDHG